MAVFVDAGYLFAQGSVALTGIASRERTWFWILPRSSKSSEMRPFSRAKDASLLRIYWYDGTLGGARLTADQALLANQDDVKVRLGFLNNAGQQKGVDSLIVTDLIELARQKSIYDAVLLSGDEDVRLGVQIPQNYGVQVHLIGIAPARGSQSHQLMQEADTTTEWGEDIIRRFLSVRQSAAKAAAVKGKTTAPQVVPAASAAEAKSGAENDVLDTVAKEFVQSVTHSDLEGLDTYWKSGERGLPANLDRRLLPLGRDALGSSSEVLSSSGSPEVDQGEQEVACLSAASSCASSTRLAGCSGRCVCCTPASDKAERGAR